MAQLSKSPLCLSVLLAFSLLYTGAASAAQPRYFRDISAFELGMECSTVFSFEDDRHKAYLVWFPREFWIRGE